MYPMLRPNLTIGNYELVRRIGTGGQGEVWLVTTADESRLLRAAKISMSPWEARSEGDTAQLQRAFEKETESLKKIQNTHVVTMHAFERGPVTLESAPGTEVRDYLFQLVAMEYSEHGDMSQPQNVAQLRDRDARERVQFLLHVAAGIRAIHDASIVHCDIKPSNVLLFDESNDLVPKISDFGAAQLTLPSGVGNLGTIEYMAPEVNDGQAPSFASDIFSLGVTFHEMLSGSLPNSKDPADVRSRDARLFFRSSYASIDYAKESLPFTDEHLRSLIQEMLAKEPFDRPPITDLINRLRGIFDSLTRTTVADQRPPSYVHADRYIWNPEVHKRLGEKMHFFYLHNLTLDGWEKIKKKLHDKQIFGYSIHRVIGETDFLLKGWFPDVVAVTVRDLVAELGDEVSLDPQRLDYVVADVLPEFRIGKAWEAYKDGKFREWLRRFDGIPDDADADAEEQALTTAFLTIGRIEELPNCIRVFLKVLVTNCGERAQSEAYARELNAFFEKQKRLKRTSGLYFVWRIDDNSTFIIEFRLTAFKNYRGVVLDLAIFLRDKNLNRRRSQFHTTTLLELDPKGVTESDDGDAAVTIRAIIQRRLKSASALPPK